MIDFTPEPHQDLIIERLCDHKRSMILSFCGSGKTSSTLYALGDLMIEGLVRGVLIIAPKRVAALTWPMEIEKWAFCQGMRCLNLRPMLLNAKTNTERELQAATIKAYHSGQYQIFTVNYDILPRLVDEYLSRKRSSQIPFDTVVFDEISYAKDPSSRRIHSFMKVIKHFDRRIGLSGTIAPNGYLDLFGPMRLIDGGKSLGTFITHFRNEYFYKPFPDSFKYLPRKGTKEKIDKLIHPYTLTLRAEDWSKVPDVDVIDHTFELSPKVRRAYAWMEEEGMMNKNLAMEGLSDEDDEIIEGSSLGVIVQKLRQVCSGAIYDEERNVIPIHDEKIKLMKKLVTKVDGPLLVATCFKHEMSRILEAFPQAEAFEEDRLRAWNENRIPIMVADFRSISHGLNLHEGGAYNTLWFSLSYSYEGYAQWNARLARLGQKNRTQIHRFICENSIEEMIADTLREKEHGLAGLHSSLVKLERLRSIDPLKMLSVA